MTELKDLLPACVLECGYNEDVYAYTVSDLVALQVAADQSGDEFDEFCQPDPDNPIAKSEMDEYWDAVEYIAAHFLRFKIVPLKISAIKAALKDAEEWSGWPPVAHQEAKRVLKEERRWLKRQRAVKKAHRREMKILRREMKKATEAQRVAD